MKQRIFFICVVLGCVLFLAMFGASNAYGAKLEQAATPTQTLTRQPSPSPTSRPGAEFLATPLSGSAPLAVRFAHTNSSILISCKWTVGDGTVYNYAPGTNFSVCPSVTHTYTTPGTYTVSLYVVRFSGVSNSVTKTNYIQVNGSLTPSPTVGCGSTVVATSTPTPTYTPTPRTATATATACGPIYITPTPNGPTVTPTITITRTMTPTITITRTPTATIPVGDSCMVVTSTITAPFTFDGAGTKCWQAATLATYINSWNTSSVTVNGTNYTNVYAMVSSLPAKINGYWYIGYYSTVAWGHFEAK